MFRCGLMVAILAPLGCEVRGVIGSSRSMDGAGEVGDEGVGTAAEDADDDGHFTTGGQSLDTSGTGSAAMSSDGQDDAVFDVGSPDAGRSCGAPMATVCEQGDDPWRAIGINCGGFDASVSHTGDPRSMVVHTGMLGTSGVYVAREGEQMLILSTGDASDIARTPQQLEDDNEACTAETCPSQQLDIVAGPQPVLPKPLDHRRVHSDRDCAEDPTLVGLGDCSNTLHSEFRPIDGWVDYTDIRIAAEVPEGADALAFEFAFFTAEYPLFVEQEHQESIYNDMYIAWLESEAWTGNVSFDKEGHPVSINSVFLDYRDSPVDGCLDCAAPELADFAAQHHAGTDWLRTVAPVVPGETILLVIAVMDISDGLFDSAILLDGFEWTCTDLPPLTTPVG